MTEPSPVIESAPAIAFGEHYTRILRYVRSVVRDAAEAEDLTQETFLRAQRRRGSLRDRGAVVPWLYTIATHVCLDRMRQRARQARSHSELDPEAVSPPDPAPSAALVVDQEDMSACVETYVSELSDSYRAVLLLHDIEGLTSREIAELLDASVGSVKIRLHRARRQLRAALEGGCAFSHDDRGTLVCDPKT